MEGKGKDWDLENMAGMKLKRKRTAAVSSLAVILLGIVALFLFWREGPGGVGWNLESSIPEVHPLPVMRAAPGPDSGKSSKGKTGRPSGWMRGGEAEKAPRRRTLERGDAQPPLEVRVFAGSKGRRTPVGGARVFLFEKSSIYGKNWRDRDLVFAENPGLDFVPGEPENRAKVFVTDKNGRAFLPLKKNGPFTRKRFGNLVWAESKDGRSRSVVWQVGRDDLGNFWKDVGNAKRVENGILELSLETSPPLRVLVQDNRGNPVVGVPVGVFHCISSPGSSRSLIFKKKTDKNGQALFRGLKQTLRKLGSIKYFWVSFLFPITGLNKNSVRLDESNLAGNPVKMTLPPVGSVQVEVEGVSKSGGGGGIWVSLFDPGSGYRDGWNYGWEWFWNRENLLNFSVPVSRGKAIFPFVGLGMKLTVFCVKQGVLKVQRKEISGPTSPGEKVFVHIQSPAGDPVITMTIVDEKGRPLGERDVWIVYPLNARTDLRFGMHDGYRWGMVRSGKDGRLAFPLPPTFSMGKLKQVELVTEGGRGSGERRVGILDFPPPFSQGRKDMGRVRLVFPPLLASGRVLDYKGNPVPGADVYVRSPVPKGKKGWSCIGHCITRKDGTFVLKMFWDWDRMKVKASKSSLGGVGPVVLPAGSKGVVLTLPGVGSIAGRALIGNPDYLKYSLIEVLLKMVRLDREGIFGVVRKEIGKDGSFLWMGLPPGLYDFYVAVNGEPKEKSSVIKGVRVLPGETTRDPRLQSVDLRGLFDEARLMVQDERGIPLKAAYIPGLNVYPDFEKPGILRILAGKGRRLTVQVTARGYYGKKVKLLPGKTLLVKLKKKPAFPSGSKGRRKREGGGVSTGGGF